VAQASRCSCHASRNMAIASVLRWLAAFCLVLKIISTATPELAWVAPKATVAFQTKPRTVGELNRRAVHYYTKALRGAAHVTNCATSHEYKRLARIHYRALMLRKQKQYDHASRVYRQALELQETMKSPDEVTPVAVRACSFLNLALTEQQLNLEPARNTFQKGVKGVREAMCDDLSQCWSTTHAGWLATLLVAWALLETKLGNTRRAKYLVRKAERLDESKSRVLSWKILEAA